MNEHFLLSLLLNLRTFSQMLEVPNVKANLKNIFVSPYPTLFYGMGRSVGVRATIESVYNSLFANISFDQIIKTVYNCYTKESRPSCGLNYCCCGTIRELSIGTAIFPLHICIYVLPLHVYLFMYNLSVPNKLET